MSWNSREAGAGRNGWSHGCAGRVPVVDRERPLEADVERDVDADLGRAAPLAGVVTACPQCGHVRLVLTMCTCGHAEIVHELASDDRRRTWCTVMTGAEGKCRCRRFQQVVE